MPDFKDTYFFDRGIAKKVALQQNRIPIYYHHTALQICYYDGPPFENPPSNLINVPVEKFVDFFTNTELRLPVDFIGTRGQDKETAATLIEVLEEIKKIRQIKAICYARTIARLKPDFEHDLPWRIVFTTGIYSDVVQYCIKTLAEEFKKKGYNVKVIIEKDYTHNIDAYAGLKHIAEFKPHILVFISNASPAWLHKDMYFVSWWQDITQQLRDGEKINWRERDLIFAQSFTQDELLILTGARNIQRQGIGVDTDVYRPRPDIKRERKVVFVGSSYLNTYQSLPACRGDNDILKVIDELLKGGRPITREIAEHFGNKYGISSSLIFEKHAAYLVRERVIEWLCRYKDIKVEIYGRYWDQNPIVKPFFKGELPFGEPVARVYNEAMYAVSPLPANITVQRLVEMGACGCIPVVYDCRHIAEKPHWDNECIFFRSRDELYACFDKMPEGNPEDIAKADSYDNFAERILSMIRKRERVSGLKT